MEVWLNGDCLAVYLHYEKPMANRQVVKEQSALSAGCKQAVHVNEVVRRILNTSGRLEWSDYVAPTVTDYMVRMKMAGYDECYRKRTLKKALQIYDRILKDDQEGRRPLNRPSQ